MDQQIIKIIDDYGDRQNHKTNVKAQMTEWQMWHEFGFKELANIVLNLSKEISIIKYNKSIEPVLVDIWGMKYKSEDFALLHDHWPSLWSFVYYVNSPEGAPGLFFPEIEKEIKIEPGFLIFFEGHVKHSVKSTKFKDFRYVVSGNIKERLNNL